MAHETLQKLTSARAKLFDAVRDLSEEEFDRQHGEGWTIREILTHLLSTEADHCKIAVINVRGQTDRLPQNLVLNDYNAQQMAKQVRMTKDQLLEGLAKQRQKTVALLNQFNQAQLELVGRHPAFGEMSVKQIFDIIATHDQLHTKDIVEALK